MTVVVATDGSDLALAAATTGLSLLGSDRRIVIVTVAHTVDPFLAEDATGHAGSTLTHDQVESQNRDAMAQSQLVLEATREALSDHEDLSATQLEMHAIEGDPGPALCDFAGDVDATVIIVGTRGRGGLKRALLGSVSDYVVRHAPCSVVVTRSLQGE
jgi:nucleotide-binding universal stress UspA family protein